MSELVKRLRHIAQETWPYAQMVSNIGKPESDNNYGRAYTAMLAAADEIERLEKERDELKARWQSMRLRNDRATHRVEVGVKPYYSDERVKIYNDDCRNILPHIPCGVVVTDPPYNIGYHYEGYKDNLSAEEYQDLLRTSCRTPSVVLHYMEDLVALSWAIEELPSKVVTWVYPSNTARQWRGIAWFGISPNLSLGGGQDYKNPTDPRIAERIMRGERARLYDWWEVDQVKNVGEEKTAHPCQIPMLVVQRIIKITDCDLIIDPFAGSGTTGRVAKDLGRNCILIEREEKYCEIAAKRLSQEVLF